MNEAARTRAPQNFDVYLNANPFPAQYYDDDGRIKRTGTVWTASAHIITAAIGSGVLSLPWAVAQLGWVAGPILLLVFSLVTYYTSALLADCYRSGDGKRNYTYMDTVKANLGGLQFKICGAVQYIFLFGTAIGCTIVAAISMVAIERSNCFHSKGHSSPCTVSSDRYMIAFGVAQIVFSQIPDIDQIWWLSVVAAVMSFTYSIVGLGLGIGRVAESGKFMGSLTGIRVGAVTHNGTVTQMDKVWRTFNSLGAIAFAYSYSMILIEIQDTIKSVPAETKTMKRASFLSVAVATIFYMLCGCFGYAAFGDLSPGNLITDFGFYNPYWLIDIANAAIVIHLVGAYQVYCQPLYAFVEYIASTRYPGNKFITKEITVPIPGYPIELNLFRLLWRTGFVIISTVIAMVMPFFNGIVGFIGAIGFWPLTVYYPVEMYIVQKKIPRWSLRWVCLKVLSLGCLLISIAAGIGSVAGVGCDLKVYKPFQG